MLLAGRFYPPYHSAFRTPLSLSNISPLSESESLHAQELSSNQKINLAIKERKMLARFAFHCVRGFTARAPVSCSRVLSSNASNQERTGSAKSDGTAAAISKEVCY